jgi:Asp-tRNA(Asn)/Glu-tRNA(Gln) amidotransferase A subunit family amidase
VPAVPSGHTHLGLPTGLQVAGRAFDDITVFRITVALETARSWLDAPERRPKLQDKLVSRR